MKNIFTIILALILTASLSICGFADETPKTGCRDYTSFFDVDELSRVLSDTANDTFMNQMETANSGADSEVTLPYKRFSVTKPDFIYRLADGEKLGDMLSSDYRWVVPGHNSAAEIVLTEENKWHTIGYSTYSQEILDQGVEKDIVVDSALNAAFAKLSADPANDIEDVICVCSSEYASDFVCVVTRDQTYLVPFGARPDFTGLTNGAVYTPDEAAKILLQNTDEIVYEAPNEKEIQFGGFGVKLYRPKTDNKINVLILIIPIVVIAAVAVVFIVVRIKNKLRKC